MEIQELQLDVPIKSVFISHTPTPGYLAPVAQILAPFGKVFSILQDKEMLICGTEFTAKRLTSVSALLGTEPYYGVQPESYGKILERLSELLDNDDVKCPSTQKLNMDESRGEAGT